MAVTQASQTRFGSPGAQKSTRLSWFTNQQVSMACDPLAQFYSPLSPLIAIVLLLTETTWLSPHLLSLSSKVESHSA